MRNLIAAYSGVFLALASFISSANGGEVLQADPGQYLHIVVTIVPSDVHKDDLNTTQISIGFTRIVFGDDGKATSVEGLNPKVEHLLNSDLEITSPTDKPVVKDGAINITFKGWRYDGHTLMLQIPADQTCRINNADWLLTKKEK